MKEEEKKSEDEKEASESTNVHKAHQVYLQRFNALQNQYNESCKQFEESRKQYNESLRALKDDAKSSGVTEDKL